MPASLLGMDTENNGPATREAASIVSGLVVNNCDLIAQGKVLVRLPALCQEVWARLTGVGAGPDGGFQYVPRIDDEVLVALNQNDLTDAFVIGGVWNNKDRSPISDPVRFLSMRVIKTGLTGGLGHELAFDDALQAITITSSTKQQITIDPEKIELKNMAGTLKIVMDNKQQKIFIEAPQIEIGGETTAQITLNAKKISIGGGTTVDTAIQGKLVRIN